MPVKEIKQECDRAHTLMEIEADNQNTITVLFNKKGTAIQWPQKYRWFTNMPLDHVKTVLKERGLKFTTRKLNA